MLLNLVNVCELMGHLLQDGCDLGAHTYDSVGGLAVPDADVSLKQASLDAVYDGCAVPHTDVALTQTSLGAVYHDSGPSSPRDMQLQAGTDNHTLTGFGLPMVCMG